MFDTIPHIIDSTRQIINVIVPPKSNFEIYAPYVAVFVSLLTVAVNIWLNNRQIKNSHKVVEKTIRANAILGELKILEFARIKLYANFISLIHVDKYNESLKILEEKKIFFNEWMGEIVSPILRLKSLNFETNKTSELNDVVSNLYIQYGKLIRNPDATFFNQVVKLFTDCNITLRELANSKNVFQ